MTLKQCTSLQGTEGDYLPTSSSDTGQLSLLSGIPMPAKFSEKEPQMVGSLDCKCGKGTLDCSIHPNTPEAWTAFMRDSLAKTLALLENKQAYLREPAQVFTEKYCASLAWYDLNTFSWKTSQQSLVTDWEPYSETWPRWGMTAGGSAYAHPMSERRITETDGSYLPTPVAADGTTGAIIGKNDTFKETRNGNLRKYNGKGTNGSLGLARHVQFWPTSTAHNAKETNAPSEAMRNTPTLAAQVGGQLNPTWVEWLMGFPIGFTDSKDWVTHKSRSKQRQRGNS